MMSAFKEALKLALYTVQDELLNDTISKNILSEAKDDWEKTEVIEATAHVLTCEIIGGAWAVMDEWGTGSLMDPANPHLADYQASGMWNPARSDTRIRSRPKGEYVNIFGEIQESKAPHPGYDLERKAEELKAAGKPVNFPVIVTPPSHALRMAIEWIKTGRLDEIVASVVMEFPFADFLEITIRG